MTVTGGMSLLVLKKGSKFFLRWIKLLRYDCELAADFVLPWDEIWSNFLNASSVKHKKGCKRLVWCWHVCYARLLVACIVQAGPQFDANGEVPEKCSHFSQPLVFLRSSRRRILCNDSFLESSSIGSSKKENHFRTWNDSTRFQRDNANKRERDWRYVGRSLFYQEGGPHHVLLGEVMVTYD